MQRGPVVLRWPGKRGFVGQVNGVGGSTVEGPVMLVVRDRRARVRQNVLAGLDDFPLLTWLAFVRWNTVHLLRVEHCIHAVNRCAPAGSGLFRLLGFRRPAGFAFFAFASVVELP